MERCFGRIRKTPEGFQMKRKGKHLVWMRSVFRSLLYTVLYMCIFLFVTITGLTIFPIIYGHNSDAAKVYACLLLIINVFIVYKWIEILCGEGKGII